MIYTILLNSFIKSKNFFIDSTRGKDPPPPEEPSSTVTQLFLNNGVVPKCDKLPMGVFHWDTYSLTRLDLDQNKFESWRIPQWCRYWGGSGG